MTTDAKWTLAGQMAQLDAEARAVHGERPPFPKNVMLELSNACNHACVFCANPKMTRPRRMMGRELVGRLLGEAHELGATRVGFYTTGDPFVHKHLATFIAQAKQIGFEYTYLSTNGALATQHRAKAVIDAGLDSIKFSINAGSRATYHQVHGSDDWVDVVANLSSILEMRRSLTRRMHVGITYVVIDRNRHEVPEFRRRFEPLVDDILFSDCDLQQGYMEENRQLVESSYTSATVEAPCSMLFSRAHISCEGYLTLCCVDYQNYLAVADLHETSLLDGWWSEPFVSMRRRHLDDDLAGTLCDNCIRECDDPVEPLVGALATALDFSDATRDNARRQQQRLVEVTFERSSITAPREEVG